MIDSKNYWQIKGVEYKDNICTVNLLKKTLGNGSLKAPSEWVKHSRQAIQLGGFYTGDMPLHYSLFRAMYQQRESSNRKNIEKARDFIKEQMYNGKLIALTKIKYNSSKDDEVIHNSGLKTQYSIQTTFPNQGEWIKDISNSKHLEALLGTSDVNEINSVFKYIIGKDACIWGFDHGELNTFCHGNTEERFVAFSADSGGVNICCKIYPYTYGSHIGEPSLGIFVLTKKPQKNTKEKVNFLEEQLVNARAEVEELKEEVKELKEEAAGLTRHNELYEPYNPDSFASDSTHWQWM